MSDLDLLPGDYAVCSLPAGTPVPTHLDTSAGIVSITWTPDEVSMICRVEQAPRGASVESPWRCLRVAGPLDLALTGVLATLVNPLASARVNVFAFSTYDTDYLLVPKVRLSEAVTALTSAGHRVAG